MRGRCFCPGNDLAIVRVKDKKEEGTKMDKGNSE